MNLIQTLLKNLQTHMNFVMETLINLFCYYGKKSIHSNIWIAGKDLMKYYYLIQKIFSVI